MTTAAIEAVRHLIALRLEMEDGAAPNGDILPISPRDPDDQPRALVCRTSAGTLLYLREDVPTSCRQRIAALGDRALDAEDALLMIFQEHLPVRKVKHIRWYTMENGAGPVRYPDVEETADGFVVVVDGCVVSRAWTTQESEQAIEVEVETAERYRGRGYAKQVVAAWADWAAGTGKVAFYSHLLANAPSARIAQSLRLTHLSDDIELL